MIAVAIAIALTSTIGGLFISYYADLASGATIVTLASVIFFLTYAISQIRK
jgi:ABC-type Mn2+/Zn2+ transport system permease subunit